MLIDIRPIHKLRGAKAIDVTASLGPIIEALCEDSLDLSRLRLACDWVQYKGNFRDVIDVRPILPRTAVLEATPDDAASSDEIEIAVDLRRCGDAPLKTITREALSDHAAAAQVNLENWTSTTESSIWGFNLLYWQALNLWEEATGQQYEDALPGGQSDARNREAVHELIQDLFAIWDDLAARNSLPDELYVVELGPGNGNQARTWLDEFVRLDREHGTEYYRRLQYLMCDYSSHVLELARKNVAEHSQHVSSFVLDATTPSTAIGFLRYKVFLVYISNVYDNLPTEEVARIAGRNYRVESRAYLSRGDAERIAAQVSAEQTSLPRLVERLLRLGPVLLAETLPEQFPGVEAAVEFWQQAWQAVRLQERYVPLPGLDLHEIAPTVNGEMLRPLLEADGDIRMHINNGAVASFVDTLPLLHPFGRMVCHDLFVTEIRQYQTRFRGPGKYDGSVVNWINGPLLQLIGNRKGVEVSFAPFAHRKGTNIVTMTAQVRD